MKKDISDLLLLGHPLLYEKCSPIEEQELPFVKSWAKDLHDVMEAIRTRYNFGRAIAAPQLGIMKRLVYMNIDRPLILINPSIIDRSEETFELWDDCMSFPNLLVRVKRHKEIKLKYYDMDWQIQYWDLKDDMSELLQHECDHLDGILCTMRAIDKRSFKWRL